MDRLVLVVGGEKGMSQMHLRDMWKRCGVPVIIGGRVSCRRYDYFTILEYGCHPYPHAGKNEVCSPFAMSRHFAHHPSHPGNAILGHACPRILFLNKVHFNCNCHRDYGGIEASSDASMRLTRTITTPCSTFELGYHICRCFVPA